MSFYGTSFIFDGIPCEDMGLVMYDFSNAKQSETYFSSDIEILEDRIPGRNKPLMYGGNLKSPLSFTLVMCAKEDRIYYNNPFDRWDMQRISSWLTGHTSYKWLEIVQPDMENYRYRCIISELKAVEIAGNKWGFSCKVTCDSPFAYSKPYKYSFSNNGIINNIGTSSIYTYPIIKINGHEEGNIIIDIENNKEHYIFKINNVPMSAGVIDIDCENGIITCSGDLNIYQYINFDKEFHFPRLYAGNNSITLSGGSSFDFICEYPVNIGC